MSLCPLQCRTSRNCRAGNEPRVATEALPGARGSRIFGKEGFVPTLSAGRSLPSGWPCCDYPNPSGAGTGFSGSAIPRHCFSQGCPFEKQPRPRPQGMNWPLSLGIILSELRDLSRPLLGLLGEECSPIFLGEELLGQGGRAQTLCQLHHPTIPN